MKWKANMNTWPTAVAILFFVSCTSSGPVAINLNKDDCSNCKMSISDKRFACELVTEKGRAYKFDDWVCLHNFLQENKDKTMHAKFYVQEYLAPHTLTPSEQLFFISGEKIESPMGGKIAAFTNKDSADFYMNKLGCTAVSQQELIQ